MKHTITRRALRGASVTLIGLGIAFWIDARPLYSEQSRQFQDPLDALDADALNLSNLHLINKPFGELVRAYVTYLASSSSFLINVTSALLNGLQRSREVLPFGLGELPWKAAEFVIRRTAFAMFAGGEDAVGTIALLDQLAQENASGLLCYSAEAEAPAPGSRFDDMMNEHLVQAHVEETLRAIEAAGRFPTSQAQMSMRPTWVAIKLTGLIRDPGVLERASEALTSSSAYQRGQRLPPGTLFPSSPLLSAADEDALSQLHESLLRCGEMASRLKVRVDIDAEQSWFQPAIDRYYELLADAYNKVTTHTASPVIFQTYQTYRKDARDRLHSDQNRAEELGLAFGAKLVRGAYVEAEAARAKSRRRASPLWPSKEETDTCFNACAIDMVDQLVAELSNSKTSSTGLMLASHNAASTRLALERFRDAGLARDRGDHLVVDERLRGKVVFGQLLGMADNLTATLTHMLGSETSRDSLPFVLKYIPYGKVEQVLPYLIRRAQENKTMLSGDGNSRGGVRHERKAVGREIRRRLGF